MMEENSHIITLKGTMVASKGMFTCNIAYIPSNWKDIRIGDMSELYAIANLKCDKILKEGANAYERR